MAELVARAFEEADCIGFFEVAHIVSLQNVASLVGEFYHIVFSDASTVKLSDLLPESSSMSVLRSSSWSHFSLVPQKLLRMFVSKHIPHLIVLIALRLHFRQNNLRCV